MTKKSIRDFSELRSLLKKTETESEARAVMKSGEVSVRKKAKLPKRPDNKPRKISATDEFIIDTLTIPFTQLPLDQLYDARLTIIDAIECVHNTIVSIQRQIEMNTEDRIDDQGRSWKQRAESAIRFKTQEGQELQRKMKLVDDLIAREKPSLKLVTPPTPPKEVAPYEVRVGVPLPHARQSGDEWRKYPFDKLITEEHSFCFAPEITDSEVRRMIQAAQRSLGKRFSYRTKEGVIWVWLNEGPRLTRKHDHKK